MLAGSTARDPVPDPTAPMDYFREKHIRNHVEGILSKFVRRSHPESTMAIKPPARETYTWTRAFSSGLSSTRRMLTPTGIGN